MPTSITFETSDAVLKRASEKARSENKTLNRLIEEWLLAYTRDIFPEKNKKKATAKTFSKEARQRVLKTLSEQKPLGGQQAWEDIHRQRTEADAGRR